MDFSVILKDLAVSGNLRKLPEIVHDGRYVISDGRKMLNLSSNDYLGIASDSGMMEEFLSSADRRDQLLSSSSSRLLTGNFSVNGRLEEKLAALFCAEAALTFTSGYHLNTGILPAVADSHTLVLADKLVHASIIDGIRLSAAKTVRFRHQDICQLEHLLEMNHSDYETVIIVVESIYSMDGDVTDLRRLVSLKKKYGNVMLYVDEAHAVGVRGETGLGVAQEQGCVRDVDFLCGTFGKALASIGAYLICSDEIRRFLVNRMRTLIFTTALPPINVLWTEFVVDRLCKLEERRRHLAGISSFLRESLRIRGLEHPSESHIVPVMAGDSSEAVRKASEMQQAGFYLLPVRPPTVPEGTSRLRVSMTAAITMDEVKDLCGLI
ncbi:MAG: 8-amino-7-oxononanoate synthase [Bacteroidales bacterium]|nr:8-amino-7-oxononanoate synthase [Bacteroidales bacterium]